ncbi:MAG: trigger factor [Saprospiraceae bacterium]
MATATRIDTDASSFVLQVSLSREEVAAEVEKELKRIRQKADLKGFRKGQAPMSMVRRLYEGSILMDVTERSLRNAIFGYVEEHKINMIGQPEMVESPGENAEDANQIEWNVKIFHLPDFELRMPDQSDVFELPEFTDIDQIAQAELNELRLRSGKRVDLPDHPLDNAIYELEISEMDEQGAELRPDGLNTRIQISLDRVRAEALRSEIRAKKVGETFVGDYHDLDMFETRELSQKYILGSAGDSPAVNPMFQCKVTNYFHIEPAELSADWLASQFGPEVDTEEKALALIAQNNQWSFVDLYKDMGFDLVKRKLIERNPFPFPFDFVKSFMRDNAENMEGGSATNESYQRLCLSVYWDKLKEKIIQQHNIEVNDNELYIAAARLLNAYSGGQLPPQRLFGEVEHLLKDEKARENVQDIVIQQKIAALVGETVAIVKKPMPLEEAREWVRNLPKYSALPPQIAPAPAFENALSESLADSDAQ